jgi:hypothetical protein
MAPPGVESSLLHTGAVCLWTALEACVGKTATFWICWPSARSPIRYGVIYGDAVLSWTTNWFSSLRETTRLMLLMMVVVMMMMIMMIMISCLVVVMTAGPDAVRPALRGGPSQGKSSQLGHGLTARTWREMDHRPHIV